MAGIHATAVIDFGVGDPMSPTPDFVIDRLTPAGYECATSGYPSYIGSPEFRQAAGKYLQREFGVKLDPETEISIQKSIATGGQPHIGGDERIYFEHGYLVKRDPNDLYGYFVDYASAHRKGPDSNEEAQRETFLDFSSDCIKETIRMRPDYYLTLSEKNKNE